MKTESLSIRPAAVAGTFYPQQAGALKAHLDDVLGRVAADEGAVRPPKILIAPHAGYVYSGAVAAHAYALLKPFRDRIRRVVLIGPAHRVAVRGIAVPQVDAFWTPLGAVRLDGEAIARVAEMPQVLRSDSAHAWEHSLEVQLPFLQAVLQEFSLVPLVVGDASPRDVASVIDALWGGPETLIVVSSDLSHYLPYEVASRVDRHTVQAIVSGQGHLDHEQACGATPINGAMLCAARHGLRPRLLDLRNSGDTAGTRDRVVGYCAIAFEAPEDERG